MGKAQEHETKKYLGSGKRRNIVLGNATLHKCLVEIKTTPIFPCWKSHTNLLSFVCQEEMTPPTTYTFKIWDLDCGSVPITLPSYSHMQEKSWGANKQPSPHQQKDKGRARSNLSRKLILGVGVINLRFSEMAWMGQIKVQHLMWASSWKLAGSPPCLLFLCHSPQHRHSSHCHCPFRLPLVPDFPWSWWCRFNLLQAKEGRAEPCLGHQCNEQRQADALFLNGDWLVLWRGGTGPKLIELNWAAYFPPSLEVGGFGRKTIT